MGFDVMLGWLQMDRLCRGIEFHRSVYYYYLGTYCGGRQEEWSLIYYYIRHPAMSQVRLLHTSNRLITQLRNLPAAGLYTTTSLAMNDYDSITRMQIPTRLTHFASTAAKKPSTLTTMA